MRRITALAASIAAFGIIASPVAAATKSVNWTFGVKTLSIKKNDTVKWTWSGAPHNVVGTGLSTSPSSSGNVSRTFTSKGSFVYYCSVHGAGVQKITIRVS